MPNISLVQSIPSATAVPYLIKKGINDKRIRKRQEPSNSVVHITITAAGTVVYTHTATSYSYVPTYSPINNNDNNNNSSSIDDGSNGSSNNELNTGAIIGGAVGGVALIALIALGFLFIRRSNKKQKKVKRVSHLQSDGNVGYIEDTDAYFRGGRTSVSGMTSSLPAPRHLVAPPVGLGTEREGDGSESKYYQHDNELMGYYHDNNTTPPLNNNNSLYPKPTGYYHHSADNSVTTTDSLPSTAIDNTCYSSSQSYYGLPTATRHIPDEVDNTLTTINSSLEERHVPHLKEEPPHSKE